jgi:hypothetical protein
MAGTWARRERGRSTKQHNWTSWNPEVSVQLFIKMMKRMLCSRIMFVVFDLPGQAAVNRQEH